MTSLISIKGKQCKPKKCVSVDVWEAAALSSMYLKITLRPLPANSFLLVLDYAKSLWLITLFLMVISVLFFSKTEGYVLVICTVQGTFINNFLLIPPLAITHDASHTGVDLWLWVEVLELCLQTTAITDSVFQPIWIMDSLSPSIADACYEQDAFIEEQ